MSPREFYCMSYRDYLLKYIGHVRSYFMDYAKYRSVAYQSYLGQPRGKGDKPVTIQKYHFLPYVDNPGEKAMTVEHHRGAMEMFKEKLRNGKRT